MLSSSLRRAAWAPIVPISGISRSSSQGLTASSNGLLGATQQVRQRRYSSSSSKPSDGSRNVDASSQTPAKGVNSAEKREGKASKRRGKENNGRNGSKSNQHTAFSRLPSVPSTQHLQPHDVHVASFFSIHRPISVSTTVPPTSSSEAFDALFTAKRSLKHEADDVMFTLSSTVDSMENAALHADQEGPVSSFEMEGGHPDGMNMADVKISIEELTKSLRPFHPPPPPVPFDEASAATATAESEGHETSSYSTVLTIHESTHADGRKTYEAHTGPFLRNADEMDAPGATDSDAIIDVPANHSETTYIERVRNNRSMHALSTKRRRRLKMKKHKFKKLLRRTRTLRRKLEKA
ncbi:mitochondrial 37S ribosomal protein mS38 [Aspergillus affinis]|uniref:mitochondrial 37S ribosomal protein mS38 n=1 Tax=Aspergillus affinis TaxID=1070780 RepID=UPI0022FDFEDA|nr:uncharacterized protein KD926_003069 [Aspergillus affinis]KAI9043719.1 hypothetical protein KD926_003069 [Aspergillus affinis]